MSLNDPLAAVLSKIKNAERIGKKQETTSFNSKLIKNILDLLNELSFLGKVEEIETSQGKALKIELLGNINGLGVIKPRYSIKLADYEKFEKRFLPAKDFGVLIVSTHKGIMTHNEAKEKKLGGRLLIFCY